ncbi:type II secretion system protein [bacterium]|nr:type II secretion system protein [bacterium]
MINRKNAFTLAEVLITLGIIGVVAALTIPTLMQKTEERETVSKLKKEYTILTNAYNLSKNDNGDASNWGTWDDDNNGSEIVLENFIPYFNVLKNCGITESGCFATSYKQLSGGIDPDYYNLDNKYGARVVLADGTAIVFDVSNSSSTISAHNSRVAFIVVDINGQKKPNKLGVDTFVFTLYLDKIIPTGIQNDDSFTFANSCADSKTATGRGCTAWVLQNENMDYMHCTGLSWGGKTKCD